MIDKSSNIQYGVALIAAPIFCLIYIEFFQNGASDIFWLLHDRKSLFMFVVLYPIVEELTFRGLIQEFIANKTKQKKLFLYVSLSNFLTSILFVLIHFVYHAPIWAMLVFFPSLIFGYFKEKYNHIVPSIVLHMFYNLCFFSLVGI